MGIEFPRRTILAKGPDWRDEPCVLAAFRFPLDLIVLTPQDLNLLSLFCRGLNA